MLLRTVRLSSFRNHHNLSLTFKAGANTIVGRNGRGKTNIIEAVNYCATLSSHRVASDAPLVEHGQQTAVIDATFEKAGRTATITATIAAAGANTYALNGAAVARPRDILGIAHTVIFAPEDLDLVKGDPAVRRKFLDDFAMALTPRIAGTRADVERVLRQRNALLKTSRGRMSTDQNETLDAWTTQFTKHAAELVSARLSALDRIAPWVSEHGDMMSGSTEPLVASYAAGWLDPSERDVVAIENQLREALELRRSDELERGMTLVGPHRDEVMLSLSGSPARGYASHGQSWSIALALRLATFSVLREFDDDPILLLDDVFAELDAQRRSRLVSAIVGVEQTIVTAAVAEDVPSEMMGATTTLNEAR